MNRKRIALVLALAAGFAIFYYLYGGSSVPKGQPSLMSLDTNNMSALKDAFNSSPSSIRVLLMLSPT